MWEKILNSFEDKFTWEALVAFLALSVSVIVARIQTSSAWKNIAYEHRSKCYSAILGWGEQLRQIDYERKYNTTWLPLSNIDHEAMALLELVAPSKVQEAAEELKRDIESWNGIYQEKSPLDDLKAEEATTILLHLTRSFEALKKSIIEAYRKRPRNPFSWRRTKTAMAKLERRARLRWIVRKNATPV